ncbi:GNAT family N-acetyltransferase [Streptomyces europaeiscabiei]|uniref:GNAT family N-acetyltransferase n=1 Tax=Streptomyces europaeiscabiei TaxID=146819 RepID=UPI0029B8D166|nr:GNAT family N-acetyltransferase [Streptomyces europaeiscabiei]MDX3867290.1 GNAT family N-acetyltransferase [Streptomyces europaeiscabiei]
MIIVRAELTDLPRLLRFRTDAAGWLERLGTDQWSRPFPASNIAASIRAGEVFLFKEDQALDAVATVTLDRTIDPELWALWTPEERAERALYVHKLVVDRQYAGRDLGGQILDWAGDLAARRGEQWLRLDAWTTNTRLHQYYLDHGFSHVRTTPDPSEVSGWLAQRPARRTSHGFDDQSGVSPVGVAEPERKMGP